MKNIISIIVISLCACSAYASYIASLTVGFFYDETEVLLEKGKAAWIVDTQALDFSDFKLEAGMNLFKNSFLDSSERFYILDVTDLDSSIAYLYSDINLNDSKFSVNDTFAVVCWSDFNYDTNIKNGTKYIVYSDSSWVIQQTVGFVDYEALTSMAGGDLSETSLILNRMVIPEPENIGIIFGIIVVIGIFISKRR